MNEGTKLTIGIVLTLILASSGTYYILDEDNAYYCQSRDMVMICEKLSSGIGTRCYYDDTYKMCTEGWIPYNITSIEDKSEIIPPNESVVISNEKVINNNYYNKLECDQTECVPIK